MPSRHRSAGYARLLTDEFGPTPPDQQQGGQRQWVRLRYHPPRTQPWRLVNGHLKPSVAGAFNNVIRQNTVDPNGTKRFAAGIGLFGRSWHCGVRNTIEENVAQGNGLGGVTLHAHLPGGQYMSGNRVVRNFFATHTWPGIRSIPTWPAAILRARSPPPRGSPEFGGHPADRHRRPESHCQEYRRYLVDPPRESEPSRDQRLHRRRPSVRERGSRRTPVASDVVITPLQT